MMHSPESEALSCYVYEPAHAKRAWEIEQGPRVEGDGLCVTFSLHDHAMAMPPPQNAISLLSFPSLLLLHSRVSFV